LTKESKSESKTIFYIPLMQRYTWLDRNGVHIDCMHIDAVGLFIEHDGSREITPELVRSHLIGSRESQCLIEADTVEEAIKIFHTNWEAASIGGEKRKAKALWVNEKVPIAGLPACELLHKSHDNKYICGEETESGNGEFGMCVLENYDAPGGRCSISQFWECYHDKQRAGTLPVETVNVDGVDYPYVMAEDLFPAESPAESPAVIV